MANSDQPTAKQLATLRSLANRKGQTFAYPATRAEASREIRRLLGQCSSSRAERAFEQLPLDGLRAAAMENAAAVRDDEIGGYGSSAHWRGRAA